MYRLSPSKLEGASTCPCYEREDTGPNEAAAEGTLLHRALETEDLSGLETEEQRHLVEMVLDYIESVKAGYGPDVKVYKEVRLPAVDRNNLPAGIVDIIIASPTKVSVADAKFGRVLVTTAEDNLQLRVYCAKVFSQWIPKYAPGVKEITGHLISPRLNDISTATFTRKIIKEMKAEIKRIEGAVVAPFKTPNPSNPSLCSMCSQASVCPAITTAVQAVIPMMGLPVADSFKAGAVVSDNDRAIAQQLADVFINWAKQTKAHNNEYARLGGSIPLHSLVRKAGTSRLTNAYEAIARLVEKDLLKDVSDALPACNTTLTKLVKLIEGNMPDTGDVRQVVQEALSDLIQPGHEVTYLRKSTKKADKLLLLADPFKTKEDDDNGITDGNADRPARSESGCNKEAQAENNELGELKALQGIALGASRDQMGPG